MKHGSEGDAMTAEARPARVRLRPLRRTIAWLRNVPVADPVDRRNAPMLQVLLLLLGSMPPLMWMYRLLAVDVPWRPGETVSFLLSMSVCGLAIFSVVLIRRGHFQWAVRQLLVVVAFATLLAYLGNGFGANRFEQPIQAVWLIVAGLLAGRRALWLMFLLTVTAFAVGSGVDGARGSEDGLASIVGDWVISSLIFLLIAVVVDRSVSALRESLAAATRRGDELARVNLQLKDEIAERERVQAQLVHAQKVEAVGRLASGVAHDFNHLLGLVLGYADRAGAAREPAELRKALDGIVSAARRASAVSQKLLNFSRREIAQPHVFDAGEALGEFEPVLRQLLDASVKLVLQVGGGRMPVCIDRAQFELVVLNVAANANQAMPRGGVLRIAASLREGQDEVEITLADDGSGMTADVLARIFEPFFTTKATGQGTGLGLSVARDIIETAGGTMHASSRPGEGTTIAIRLPLHRDEG
jgi:signal transduction histidine kinase